MQSEQKLTSHQGVIAEKMAAFLVLKAKTEPAAPGTPAKFKKEGAEFVSEVKKDITSHGLCFSFAMCQGAMGVLGLSKFWNQALTHLAKWDGRAESLSDEIILDGVAESQKVMKLGQLFERMSNYIIINHPLGQRKSLDEKKSFSYQRFEVKGVSQKTMVRPRETENDPAYFEVLDEKNELYGISDLQTMVGNFEFNTLALLLDEREMAGKFCLCSNENHSICISYINSKWIIYDPNYPVTELCKEFETKEAAAIEIIERLKKLVTLEIITLNPANGLVKDAQELVEPKAESKSEDEIESGTKFSEVKEDEGDKQDKKEDQKDDHESKDADKTGYALYQDLIDDPERINTIFAGSGLRLLLLHDPKKLDKIIETMSETPEGKESLAMLLVNADSDNRNGLATISCFYPQALEKIIAAAKESKEWPKHICKALTDRRKVRKDKDPYWIYSNGWGAFHVIIKTNPDLLPDLLNSAADSKDFPLKILNMLAAGDELSPERLTGRKLIESKAPALMESVMYAFTKSLTHLSVHQLDDLKNYIKRGKNEPSHELYGLYKRERTKGCFSVPDTLVLDLINAIDAEKTKKMKPPRFGMITAQREEITRPETKHEVPEEEHKSSLSIHQGRGSS